MKCYHVYDSRSDEYCFDVYADSATTTIYDQVVFMRDDHIYCVVSNAYYTEDCL